MYKCNVYGTKACSVFEVLRLRAKNITFTYLLTYLRAFDIRRRV